MSDAALYGVDVHAQYQAGLDIAQLKAEGYSFLVTKASEGVHIPPLNGSSAAFKARYLSWVAQTRAQDMTPGLYHWIDSSAGGAAQARYFYRLVVEAAGPGGMLIQLDCEDDASYQQLLDWRDEWVQLSAGHPFLLYTGGWWWRQRGWDGAALTPWLWDSRYLTADADTISDDPAVYAARIPERWWTPGYGGWPSAAIMQFLSRGDAGSLGNNVDLNVLGGGQELLATLTGGQADMTPTEHNWLYNLGSITRGLADGADSVDQVVPDGANGGQHYTLSLAPFWDKVGGAELGAGAIAAIAKAAAEGASTGAGDAVADLKLDIKLTGSAENTG